MQHNLSDPTDLDGLRAYLKSADANSRLSPLNMQGVVISDTAHLEVAQHVSSVTTKQSCAIVLLTDKTAIKRRGENLAQSVTNQLARHKLNHVILDDGHPTLHVDQTTLATATAAVAGADLVVTIGGGTMTDIGKVSTNRNGNIPLISMQTAASVDGFTDDVSVVLRNGVKRTIPSRWPTIVLADTVTIAEAPRELNTSGFGEAISLFTAPADWYLANLVGLDTTFHPASMDVLKAAAANPPDWSAGVATGEASAIHKLTSLLALRGIVSGISNTTACLSGVEHVISHMLDLHHAAKHQPVGLHGAQVGVASLVASKLWRNAIETDLVLAAKLQKPDARTLKARIEKAFAPLGQNIVDECWRDCQKKLDLLSTHWARLVDVVQNWSTHCKDFDKMVQPSHTLRTALRASGSPATFASLNPQISTPLATWAITNCHLMRNRFNLVDLLDLMGLWTEDRIAWAMAEVQDNT